MSDQDFITTDEDDYLDVEDNSLPENPEDFPPPARQTTAPLDNDDYLGSGGFELPFNAEDGVIAHLIDIREPLYNFKTALEKRLGLGLRDYDFWLQDTQRLPENTTLVEQCVQGEGLVQINVEIKTDPETDLKKINIVDVLKPADEVIAEATRNHRLAQTAAATASASATARTRLASVASPLSPEDDWESSAGKLMDAALGSEELEDSPLSPLKSPTGYDDHAASGQGPFTRWVVCSAFRKEQERLNIPTDPMDWQRAHVSHWIQWAQAQFPNASIDSDDWRLDGRQLCSLSQDEFKRKVPLDPSDMMWTHVELLRKCKFVAVIQKSPHAENASTKENHASAGAAAAHLLEPGLGSNGALGSQMPRKTHKKPPVRLGTAKFTVMSESALGNRTGNNGQVQLWQFLLELLTEKNHREAIHWIGEDGEFKLENPEIVAQLWGTRKNKPSMNYEKLSRALRYYYDGDMISKVQGKRFVYKFVCDLKQLIGYSAAELNRLVSEAEMRSSLNTNHNRLVM
ncbi:hypothetical protein TCAL_10776 [Tigriopus californicus]|uniref:ETS domain-containing protein n=1 Tax=Tigriopus californicus TaxID=6832 RepID=A0A553NFD8_TIGCA|nr:DNA-binding protein Ets97D-like [Tigriopus californicus]TRY64089.1 hypothetical protein TCAL_10776 [Tigriopus californicus]|eukprot:TCALIF_10776-PA protein Name:"Similar to Ets97D DNA-binding protein Ets97D (Drosophila melanogaster)" AED:0.03 eAED:0.03 QI:0/-1/0/1/-1/1/1/0/514